MSNQSFNFEAFNRLVQPAMEGIGDAVTAVKDVVPLLQEIAKQNGSEKLMRTVESYSQVAEETFRCFESVGDSLEEVKQKFSRIEQAVN